MKIHPTAIVSKKANIDSSAQIGPYSIVEEGVVIGKNTELLAHAHICKGTSLGEGCVVHMGAVLGDEPQDLSYKGEVSYLEIGNNNIFREHVTLHRATGEGRVTKVGNSNYFMALSHVGHNSIIGNHVVLCNCTLIAGHVHIHDKAFLSGACLVHQFTRIGTLAFLGGGTTATKDVPPFMMLGNRNEITGYNKVGIQRAGLSLEARKVIKDAYKILFTSGDNLTNAMRELDKLPLTKEIKILKEFFSSTKRGVCLKIRTKNRLHK
ncbi:MAG: acyl-ACP--UDP-N-acetylglucosamine O-acyltransferase [Candidatus Omnitrophota bacterium]